MTPHYKTLTLLLDPPHHNNFVSILERTFSKHFTNSNFWLYLSRTMRLSCNGCRVLRRGCTPECPIRTSLQWIKSSQSQSNATLFLAKFYGRQGLLNLLTTASSQLQPGMLLLISQNYYMLQHYDVSIHLYLIMCHLKVNNSQSYKILNTCIA